jgi:hypothetical protein
MSEQGFWKRKEAPEQPQERWRPPLMVFVGGEDDGVEEDLQKLLAARGLAAPPRRFWQRIWPPSLSR